MMFFLGVLPTWEEIANVFIGMIKGLFLNLCLGIFSLVGFLFDILVKITEVDLMDVNDIYQRAIMIFTIVITFYITFEFVKYTVSPDNISDKEKGAMPLFARIIIAILLLAFTPRIFTIAMDLQNRVINTQVLPKVILGTSGQDLSATGRDFSADLFSVFYRFDRDACLGEYNNRKCNDIEDDVDNVIKKLRRKTGIEKMLFGGSLFSSEFWTQMKVGVEFNPLFAIVFGGFMLYVLFMYCKDVALRYVQLLFLQIISPIAIISYIAPKKDGIFQKWLKQCTTTYLDIFIRLALLYFLMLVMKQFLGHNLTSGGMNANLFAKLFIIFALLRFLLKAPKLLEELFPKSGAASIGYGFSAKDRHGILGSGRQIAARTGGMLAGGIRAFKGRKNLLSDAHRNQKGFKAGLRKYGTYANAIARSASAGFKAGKDGKLRDAILAGQEKVQEYETIVSNKGTVLGHDYLGGHYQNVQAGIKLDIEQMEKKVKINEAKSKLVSSVKTAQDAAEDRSRKKIESHEQKITVRGTDTASLTASIGADKMSKYGISISAGQSTSQIYSMFEAKANSAKAIATATNQELVTATTRRSAAVQERDIIQTSLNAAIARGDAEETTRLTAELNDKNNQISIEDGIISDLEAKVIENEKSEVELKALSDKALKELERYSFTRTLEGSVSDGEKDAVLEANIATARVNMDNIIAQANADPDVAAELRTALTTSDGTSYYDKLMNHQTEVVDFDTYDTIQGLLSGYASTLSDDSSKINEDIRRKQNEEETLKANANAAGKQ